jgi:catechol 2,3-dioxygenase-like lactoylglutathione lyase family enzyme
MTIKIEHLGYMVQDPVKVAEWYTTYLGFTVVRILEGAANAHFLADGSGQVMVEIYNNPLATVPDYASMDPLLLHLAFAVDDPVTLREQLLAAGASAEGEVTITPTGDQLAMMRDPWGFAIQLARRKVPMV